MRGVNPSAWPQLPHDEAPRTPELSEPRYELTAETGLRLGLRDGVRIAYDVFRPSAPGRRFPALVAWSPYGRQVQRTSVPIPQNEAGITEFWVPRGYVHVIADARGSNDSEGDWDLLGPTEIADLVELVDHVAAAPWCDGRVGMVGCSYFGVCQNQLAALAPPSLKAIFPQDALTDWYRDAFFHGGIPAEFARDWAADVTFLNAWSGRRARVAGIERHVRGLLGLAEPFDGPYYRARAAWPVLGRIGVPAYFGTNWRYHDLHLRGALEAWTETGSIEKRLLLGPRPLPMRPYATYHLEALRWYDLWLKELDTGVLDGDPIRIWVQGEDRWRGEREWPLARTTWREWFLGGPGGGLAGTLEETPGDDSARTYAYRPQDAAAWVRGEPRLVYRSPPLERELEVTGPVALTLVAASTAEDTDWIAWFCDEAPDGTRDVLAKGWLRASHRALDPERTLPYRPWHPHTAAATAPVPPGEPGEYAIEIWPTSNLFRPGHRLRLELASCDPLDQLGRWANRSLFVPADNTVLEGRTHRSRLLLPVIPRP